MDDGGPGDPSSRGRRTGCATDVPAPAARAMRDIPPSAFSQAPPGSRHFRRSGPARVTPERAVLPEHRRRAGNTRQGKVEAAAARASAVIGNPGLRGRQPAGSSTGACRAAPKSVALASENVGRSPRRESAASAALARLPPPSGVDAARCVPAGPKAGRARAMPAGRRRAFPGMAAAAIPVDGVMVAKGRGGHVLFRDRRRRTAGPPPRPRHHGLSPALAPRRRTRL